MMKSKYQAIIVILLTVICFSGRLTEVSAQNKKESDTLRILIWEAPDPVWPYSSKAYKDLEIVRIVYEPLASFDIEGKLTPFLASEIPSRENGGLASDGKSVTWKLKQGIQWADGEPFTADDVIFTYKHIMSSSPLMQKGFKARYAMMLQDGIADFAWNSNVNDETLARLEALGKGRFLQTTGPNVEFIMLNFTDPKWDSEESEHSSLEFPHPFFSDKKVRQAIAHAIDREAIAALYGKTGRPAENILVAPDMYRSPNPHYEFDLKKAAVLLDDAGWKDHDGDSIRDKNGVKLIIRHQTTINPLRRQIQKIIKRCLNSIGVEVVLKATEASIFFSRDVAHNKERARTFYADLQEWWTGNSSPDPAGYMARWLSGNIPQKSNDYTGLNWERWASPEYDRLYARAVVELDPEKRRHLFIRLNDLLVDEVVRIPLVNKAVINAVGNDIKGVELTPWDAIVWKIKDWKRKP